MLVRGKNLNGKIKYINLMKHFKLNELPDELCPNAVYFIDRGSQHFEIFVTSCTGVARSLFSGNPSSMFNYYMNRDGDDLILQTGGTEVSRVYAPAIEQNNILKPITLPAIGSISTLISTINSLPEFTVTETEIAMFLVGIDGQKHIYGLNLGKGTYGQGSGVTIQLSDLTLIYKQTKIKEDLIYVTLSDLGATSFDDNLSQLIKNYAIANNITKEDESLHSWIVEEDVRPFEIISNGVTVRLKTELGFGVGTTGLADNDTSGKIYTAVDDITIRQLDPATDDYTSVCTTLCNDMVFIFSNADSFNQNINSWDVSNVTDMRRMFNEATSFNQPINAWDVSNVTYMSWMFYKATSFNQPLNNWNVSSVTRMNSMFHDATLFNQNINSWNVSSVTDMNNMFDGASSFNQPFNNWDVSNVIDMREMFESATSFNQPLNSWNVFNVTNMRFMFYGAESFNQPLNNWNVSSVNDMTGMFNIASAFNQPLDNWNVSIVTDMTLMFAYAVAFNQDLSSWCVEQIATEPSNFDTGATAWVLSRPNWGTLC